MLVKPGLAAIQAVEFTSVLTTVVGDPLASSVHTAQWPTPSTKLPIVHAARKLLSAWATDHQKFSD